MDLELYTAIITDINDPDKQGKVKIKILPELEGTKDDLLPWAVPFINETSKNTLNNNLPSVNSTIRVLADFKSKRFYYLGNRYFPKLFDFSKVDSKISELKDIDTDYKNLKFTLYEDGSLTFHNISDGSNGFIQSTGSYTYFDSKGNITTNLKTGTKFKLGNNVNNLGAILKELMTDLSQLQTSGSPTNHTSPQLTLQMNQLLQKLNDILITEG